MMRTMNNNLIVQNVPWTLTIIPGSSKNNKKLVSQLLTVISKLSKFQKDNLDTKSAFLNKYREDFPEVMPPIVLSFVACCTLVEVDLDTKKLVLLFCNWPVAFIRNLTEQVGLICPTNR